MTLTNVKAHVRGKPDPLAPVIEARRQQFANKWRIEIVGVCEERPAVPVEIERQAMEIVKMLGWN